MNDRTLIIGAGGHGHVIADILVNASREPSEVIGFLDDDEAKREEEVSGIRVVGSTSEIDQIPHESVVLAIGDNRIRAGLSEKLDLEPPRLKSAIHSSAIVARSARVGSGSMLCAGVIVNAEADVGRLVILNTAATVEHHCKIGDYSHVAPSACLGGGAKLGRGVLLGLGAKVLPGLEVGDWSVIGAGAVVTGDVPSGCVAVGVPARVTLGSA